jgi:mRNA-degrading endonuclease RelE of RelBE toxin-antitoxin system
VPDDYSVYVIDHVADTLRGLGHEVSRPVGYQIRQLAVDPRPIGSKRLRGTRSLHRIHVDIPGQAAYRVIYSIADDRLVVVAVAVRRKSPHTYRDLPNLQREAQEFLQDLDDGV